MLPFNYLFQHLGRVVWAKGSGSWNSHWNHGVGTLKRWNHGTMILNKRTSGWSRSGGLGGRVLEAEQFLLTW